MLADESFGYSPMMEASRVSPRTETDDPHASGDRALRKLKRLEGLVLVLFFLMALLAFALMQFMTNAWHEAKAAKIAQFYAELRLTHARSMARHQAAVQNEVAPPVSMPAILTSVVRFQEGEEMLLQKNLIAPLLAFDSMMTEPKLEAVLIERTNASSRDVRVRLFTKDGAETGYLWPSTHSEEGMWVSDCVDTIEEIDVRHPTLCPEGYVRPSDIKAIEAAQGTLPPQ